MSEEEKPVGSDLETRKYPESSLLVGAAQSVWDGSTALVRIEQRGKRKLQVKTMWKRNVPGASC